MRRRISPRSLTVAALFALLSSPCLTAAGSDAVPPVATKFLLLFDRLRTSREHVSFRLSADEINDYMSYALRTTPRPGIESVKVKIFAHNYISTYTVVDFDAVERSRPGTIPGFLRPMLHGKKPVWVDCRFHTVGPAVGFSVEKAYYDNVRLPAFFVEKMIQIVAGRQPEKYDTSKPVPLPFGLRKLWTVDQTILGEN